MLCLVAIAFGQKTDTIKTKKKNWYELLSIRGYSQVRYNRLLETNAQLKCEQCDRSWGENGGFFIRRARIILFGNVHERVYVYLQPDLANAVGTSTNYGRVCIIPGCLAILPPT